MSKKITIVIESLGGGGAQHVAATLANAWVGEGIDVCVITFQGPETDIFKLNAQIHRVVIGGSKPSRNLAVGFISNLRRVARLRAALRASPGQTVLAFVGSTNIVTLLASVGLGDRVVISERNDPARQSLGRVWDWLRKRLYRRADLVIANSLNAIDTMAEFVPRERLRWLPNPLRTAPQNSNDPVPVTGPFFLAVGRLALQKGYDVVIEAFAELAQSLPSWALVILGDGPLRVELTEMALARGISERLHLVGFVPNPFPWYRAAQVLVHAARFEGLPNVVLEAMSEGLPVVITDAQEGLCDLLVDSKTGIVVPVESPGALRDAMLRLAGDAGLRRRLGSAARDAVAALSDSAVSTWTTTLDLKAPQMHWPAMTSRQPMR